MKAGDKVKCVNAGETPFTVLEVGKVYTVDAVVGNLGMISLVEVALLWNSLRFVPVEEPKP